MLKYAVDHVAARDGQIFIYGWGFVPDLQIEELALLVQMEGGEQYCFPVNYGERRNDVQQKYCSDSEALNSGFSVYTEVVKKKITRLMLRWRISSGEEFITNISFTQVLSGKDRLSRLAHYWILGKKTAILLKNSGLKAVWNKVNIYNKGRPTPITSHNWKSLVSKFSGKPLILVIDHELGGGANIYRRRYINGQTSQSSNVLLFGFHVASLQLFIEFYDGHSVGRYSIPSLEVFTHLIGHFEIARVVYNGLSSFPHPLDVVKMITALRDRVHCPLQVLVHDYLPICPSHFLINQKGVFCGIPDKRQCESCLKGHTDGFVAVSGIRDIGTWRTVWGGLLEVADEVTMFSEASYKLLARAYPEADKQNWQIVPHQLHTRYPKISVPNKPSLHIGVVGLIGRHKGARIISDLAKEILQQNSDAKITVIGTLEARVPKQVVEVTGPYQPAELSEMIQNSGANIFLFPSIWAETFSFVAHELASMNVLLACFDYGAQADLVRKYERGLILSSQKPSDILRELEDFWINQAQVAA